MKKLLSIILACAAAASASAQLINVQKTTGTFLVTNVNSITSAATQNFLLGTGSFGTALTFSSATGATAFAAPISQSISATAASQRAQAWTWTDTFVSDTRPVGAAMSFNAAPSTYTAGGFDWHGLDIVGQTTLGNNNFGSGNRLYPFEATATNNVASGTTLDTAVAGYFQVRNAGTGNLGTAWNLLLASNNVSIGAITDVHGIEYRDVLNGGGGSVTNQIAVNINALSGATNNYGIYIDSVANGFGIYSLAAANYLAAITTPSLLGSSGLLINAGIGASNTITFKTTTAGSTQTQTLLLDGLQNSIFGTSASTGSKVGINRSATTTINSANGYLSLGSSESTTNDVRLIWAGYKATTYQPGYFGFKTTANTNNTFGDWIWGGRAVDTDTQPNLLMTLSGSGVLTIGQSAGGLTVAGAVSVGGNVSLSTAGNTVSIKSGSNAAAGTFTMVAGSANVTSTAIDANTVIHCTIKTVGGTTGVYTPLTTTTAGSFTATSIATDSSTYNWVAMKVN